MGIADLAGPWAKLDRAYEHLDVFGKEFWEFSSQQESKSVRVKFRCEEGWYVVYIDPLPLPPVRLALIAGDCLQNLRAALDHLIWQLVLREDQKPSYTHHFPACETWDQFCAEVIRKPPKKKFDKRPLRGIPVDGDAWTIIQKAQPFVRAKSQDDALFLLARMSNFDKHRTLLTRHVFPEEETITKCIQWNPNFQLVEKEFSLSMPSYELPTKIMRLRFTPDGDPGVYVKGKFIVFPTLGDGETQVTLELMKAIYERVRKILDQVATLPRVQRKTGLFV
jgi:hypothetical protein